VKPGLGEAPQPQDSFFDSYKSSSHVSIFGQDKALSAESFAEFSEAHFRITVDTRDYHSYLSLR
jgi:hypothetical protein